MATKKLRPTSKKKVAWDETAATNLVLLDERRGKRYGIVKVGALVLLTLIAGFGVVYVASAVNSAILG